MFRRLKRSIFLNQSRRISMRMIVGCMVVVGFSSLLQAETSPTQTKANRIRGGASQRATVSFVVQDENGEELPKKPKSETAPKSSTKNRTPSFDEAPSSNSTLSEPLTDTDETIQPIAPQPSKPSHSARPKSTPPLVQHEPAVEEQQLMDESLVVEGEPAELDESESVQFFNEVVPELQFQKGFWANLDPNLQNLLSPKRYEFTFGGQAFSGPTNYQAASPRASAGASQGIQEGFQWSAPAPWIFNGKLSIQVGALATQNSLHGSPLFADRRDQVFFTAGMFRRVDYGVQGGVVLDYLEDDWYYEARLSQLRGELSFRGSRGIEWGFRWTSSLDHPTTKEHVIGSNVNNARSSTFEATDTYRFFYRRPIEPRSPTVTSISLGFSENKDFLIDCGLETPLRGSMGIRTGATYLVPTNDVGDTRYQKEAWAFGISLVFTPGRRFGCGSRYHRPLLDVANYGSFLIHRR